MNLFNFGSIIGDAIADMWMSIWLSLNDLVYNIIELLFRVFDTVAKINLFSDKDYKMLTGRVYVIMGVAMLFILAYNLILMIINPEDKKGTGQMTKMVKEIIISLVLIVLLPRIFNYMAIFQRHLLDSNILGQIIIGDTGGTMDNCGYDQYNFLGSGTKIQDSSGSNPDVALNNDCIKYTDNSITSSSVRGAYSIAPTLFSAFYHPTEYGFTQCKEYYDECKDKGDSCTTSTIYEDNDKEMCKYYFHDVKKAVFTGSLKPFNEDSFFYSKVKKNDETFEFNYLLAFVAGCLAVYMFACYTIAIGVRVAKLGFLQILSPIAVMMRIIPKQKEAIFDKWLKNLKNTYLDVFIRLIIIYFSLFAISLVPGVIDNMGVDAGGGGISGFAVWLLAKVILILGILKFAQDAPALIKDFFGNAGNFSLKSPKKQLSENKLAMAGMGMAGGMVSTGVKNFNAARAAHADGWATARSVLGGAGSGMFRGARAGYKSTDFRSLKNNTTDAINRAIDARESRDERQAYDEAHGYWGAYRANRAITSIEQWAHEGGSLKPIQDRRDAFNKVYEGYKKVLDTTKDYIESHKSSFNVNGQTILEYEMQKNRAAQLYSNFSEDEYLRTHAGATMADATAEADRLRREAATAERDYNDVVDGLTDALVQYRRTNADTGTAAAAAHINANITFHNDDGTERIEHANVVSTGNVTNLGSIIQTADNTRDINRATLGTELYNQLSDNANSDRARRNNVGGHVAELDSEIARRREQQSNNNK